MRNKSIYESLFKRPFDLVMALLALILLSPILLLVAIFVKIKMGSPVLFAQERPGKNGEIFRLYKFRTMTNEKNAKNELLPVQVRLTRLGRFLRSTSMDELPELINILKGDMSLVGPRPLLVKYLSLYDRHQSRRHLVRPGLTGLAQVSGRNSLKWEDKFNYDVFYVDNLTFVMDLKIMFKTVLHLFKRDGINNDNSDDVEEFNGNLDEV